jgi:hypothetical protein
VKFGWSQLYYCFVFLSVSKDNSFNGLKLAHIPQWAVVLIVSGWKTWSRISYNQICRFEHGRKKSGEYYWQTNRFKKIHLPVNIFCGLILLCVNALITFHNVKSIEIWLVWDCDYNCVEQSITELVACMIISPWQMLRRKSPPGWIRTSWRVLWLIDMGFWEVTRTSVIIFKISRDLYYY